MAWTNYRRIPDAELMVRDRLMLVGPNDSGKSSVLQALHLCLGAARSELSSAITVRDFTDMTQPLRLSVTLTDLTTDEAAAFPDEVDATGAEDTVTIAVEAMLDAASGEDGFTNDVAESLTVRRFFVDAGHSRGPSRAQLEAISWFFLPASRSLTRELGGQSGMLRALLNSLDLIDEAAQIEAATAALKQAVDQATTVKSLREALASALDNALPRHVQPDDVQISTPMDLGESALSAMSVTIVDGDHLAGLAAQSDGLKALSLLAVLSVAQSGTKIVCVDEPENHLHVTAQRAVIRAFQSSPSQTIMASHSAAMICRLHPCDVVAFGPDRVPRQLAANSTFASATTAAKYWTPALVEALTAHKIFFVEGQSDVIVVETVADLMGLRLDRAGVAIVGLDGGSSFPSAYRLLSTPGFGVPASGMVDEDKRTTWADGLGVDPGALEAQGYLVCQPDLEAMYIDALGVPRVLELLRASPDVKERSILQMSAAASLDEVTADGLAKFCRKYKVPAAVALSQGMTRVDAESMPLLVSHLKAMLG
ncbi:ATP-dependent nuclease [Cryptosporangium minutisporangium]|uniref:ATP-dependent nuclease n=1 Tax=Cryptosporangium minutisporangium TaxID=113569 RepID=UPI0031EF9680